MDAVVVDTAETATTQGSDGLERGPHRKTHLAVIREHRNAVKEAKADSSPAARTREARLLTNLEELQKAYEATFLPVHSGRQLISPQQLLMSQLFNVRAKTSPRDELVSFDLLRNGAQYLTYKGPELRQQDSLVFMSLINMTRDLQVGTPISFEPGPTCTALFGYYDGESRNRLREAIYRLQHAVLRFPAFSVQLAQRFDYPQKGPWTVMLDPQIVELFKQSRLVWMDFELRKKLPEGLPTWLYAYVEGQTKLIPTPTEKLWRLCGSDAKNNKTFQVVLRRALNSLEQHGVIDSKWGIKKDVLHWMKPTEKEEAEQSRTFE
ncbi:hypothetical protein LC612_33060 [Nostoc sp. CHAB 5834]|nr:hypothetical protein [Nostoc sp. CHAB 5834]